MRTNLIALLLAVLMLMASPVMALAAHEQFTPCCKGGSSPWASESPDTFKSNKNAGYQGSELPPSSGYHPDHLDKYDNPALNRYPYQQEPASGASPMFQERSPLGYGGGKPEGTCWLC